MFGTWHTWRFGADIWGTYGTGYLAVFGMQKVDDTMEC